MAYTYKNYEESDAMKKMREQLQQVQLQKPEQYQSQWAQKQQQAASDYMNRPDFKYSLNGDPLYQQYKEQYQRQGKLAMQDTIGQAAAMNGGYGSSYGQMAGQQVYDSKLQQLNDRVPELYNLALSKYQADGEQLLNRFNLAASMEGQDYSRYQDALSAWQNERDYAAGRYDNERSTDYNLWADMDSREYSRYQDAQKLAQAQVDYLLSLGITPEDGLLEKAGYNGQYVKERINQAMLANQPVVQYVGGYSGGSSGSKSNVSLITEASKIQQAAGRAAAVKYLEDQTGSKKAGQMGSGKTPEAVMAMDTVKGMSMTDHYKKMMDAQNAKKK